MLAGLSKQTTGIALVNRSSAERCDLGPSGATMAPATLNASRVRIASSSSSGRVWHEISMGQKPFARSSSSIRVTTCT